MEKPKKKIVDSKLENIPSEKKELSDSSKNEGQESKTPDTKGKINTDASKGDEKNQILKTNKKDSSENEINNDSQSGQKEPNKLEKEKLK